MGIPKMAKLTPASMRTCGAISAFRKGTTVSGLLWKMRLCSAVTLEFYFQEMTAVDNLPSLGQTIRRRIRAAACFAAHFLCKHSGA